MHNINLENWADLDGINTYNLLIGNGFSINVWNSFSYNSLMQEVRRSESNFLKREEINLFDIFDTVNFEEILRNLNIAEKVAKNFDLPYTEKIQASYVNVRSSLIRAVSRLHAPPEAILEKQILNELKKYHNIYTTNYDTLIYNSLLAHTSELQNFKDYFWGFNKTFNAKDTNIHSGRYSTIKYLHGALHLTENSTGEIQKANINSISQINQYPHDTIPLFVSEGTWQNKMRRIAKNQYLDFCYRDFKSSFNGLVVLGHSLSEIYDYHLIEAINESYMNPIAISIYPTDASTVEYEKARIRRFLRSTKSIKFFNSKTHPLTDPNLKYTPLNFAEILGSDWLK